MPALVNASQVHSAFSDFQETGKAGHQWLMNVILATSETEIRRIEIRGQPKQIVRETPISKITRAKWTRSAVHAVKCLLCNHEGLSSNKNL
jgi:hypothetical protein